ncbi:transmembrane protein, putative (macronuclear) [Tetrahymena thermophila SB210]|uniref:Transmembrane protein, putative n=1 Tax=Tetrahymena thermophila (strain SB210) TaxID=312017 RepID=I7M1P3_TETTS|nr:transmembrane protein, putative [Tetrahymena thermophila SB210]EAR97285.2 transmembrane protein, putative [Tetrahymena thermophila SB210]|eukprot:XP_001017530.2 transmembrane protein, putative [Tetrahymena thermophila SB210]
MQYKNEMDDLLIYQLEQYKLKDILKQDFEVSCKVNNTIQQIVETCKEQCLQLLEKRKNEYDQYIQEQQQQELVNQPGQIPAQYQGVAQYEDDESQELKKAIYNIDHHKMWCSFDEIDQNELEFPSYMIPLYKKHNHIFSICCVFIFIYKTNKAKDSYRQRLFPSASDAFYFIEFFVNIILFVALLIFGARINAIVLGQNDEQEQELVQINNQIANDEEEFQNIHNQREQPLHQSEAYARSQIIKSSRLPNINNINSKFVNNNIQSNQSVKMYDENQRDINQNRHHYLNDTLSKLNETKQINQEDTIYVNQNDIAYSQMNFTNVDKPEVTEANQKNGNQIFTLNNQFLTEENPHLTICNIGDNKIKKFHKPNQVYPLKDEDYKKKQEIDTVKQNDKVNESAYGMSYTNQETQEKSISRVTSSKNIALANQTKTLYKKDISQNTLTTKSTQNNLLDTTADRSLNLTSKQLLQISKINQTFQTNKSNLNNMFLKHQYDMNYWGSQFCEYSPAIKTRRTIDKYKMEIPPSLEDHKMSVIESQRQLQIKKQEEERIKRMNIAEQELQNQIQQLQQNQDELKKKYEQDLANKLREKEENEQKLKEELNSLILESERKEREAKEREEQERLRQIQEQKEREQKNKEIEEQEKNKKISEASSKKNIAQLIDPNSTIQEEEEQNNSSLINNSSQQNQNNNIEQSPSLQRDNPNGQSKSKKQFKVASTLKINPSIIEEEEGSEREQNFIVFDDDYKDKDTDRYIDINTFVKQGIGAPNSGSLSQFPLSVLKEPDYNSQAVSIDEDENHLNELIKLQELSTKEKNLAESKLISSSQKNELNEKENKYSEKKKNESINTAATTTTTQSNSNATQGNRNQSSKEEQEMKFDKYATLQQKDNDRYKSTKFEEGNNTIDITQGIAGADNDDDLDDPQVIKKNNFNLSKLNQTVNSFYVSKSNTQSDFFHNVGSNSKKQQTQTLNETRKSENLQQSRPNTSNNQVPILQLNNFNRGANNNSIMPNPTTYQSIANKQNALQNLDSHREIQRQNLIRQAENYLNNNNNYSGSTTPIQQNEKGSSRMELIGQDDYQNSPDPTQRESNPFRILQDYRMRIIGVNDFDEDILKSISHPETLSRDYSKSEYQKMKQIFTRGQSNSRLQTHPLKQHGNNNVSQQKLDSNQNVIL